jgi:hypothetical protein
MKDAFTMMKIEENSFPFARVVTMADRSLVINCQYLSASVRYLNLSPLQPQNPFNQ